MRTGAARWMSTLQVLSVRGRLRLGFGALGLALLGAGGLLAGTTTVGTAGVAAAVLVFAGWLASLLWL